MACFHDSAWQHWVVSTLYVECWSVFAALIDMIKRTVTYTLHDNIFYVNPAYALFQGHFCYSGRRVRRQYIFASERTYVPNNSKNLIIQFVHYKTHTHKKIYIIKTLKYLIEPNKWGPVILAYLAITCHMVQNIRRVHGKAGYLLRPIKYNTRHRASARW